MFYSQIILQKKGPLGDVWKAAHFGDKNLKRKDIFAANISSSVDNIVHPQVPLALRVSGHLLLGVVRIYSKKVHYLFIDAQEAMTQIQTAFAGPDEKTANIDLSNRASSENHDIAHFGEYLFVDATRASTAAGIAAAAAAAANAGHVFEIPFDLQADDNAEDWVPAECVEDIDVGRAAGTNKRSTMEAMMHQTQQTQGDTQDSAAFRQDPDLSMNTDFSSTFQDTASMLRQSNEDEGWTAFNPEDDDDEDEDDEEADQSKDKQDDNEQDTQKDAGAKADDGAEKEATQQGEDAERDGSRKPAEDEGASIQSNKKDDDESRVSDIEMVRAANISASSDDHLRQSSTFGDKSVDQSAPGQTISPGGPEARGSRDEDDDDVAMHFHDDDEELPPPPGAMGIDDSHISMTSDGQSQSHLRDGRTTPSIGGLDISTDTPHSESLRRQTQLPTQEQEDHTLPDAQEETAGEEGADADDEDPNKRKRPAATRRKRRKLRKVIIDNGNTELSKSHIKEMLADTDDIVRESVHPATYVPGLSSSKPTDEALIREHLGYERLFSRPALADDGFLHPALVDLWARNTAPVQGKPFPYKLRDGAEESTRAVDDEEEDEESDVEHARQQEDTSVGTDEEKLRASMDGDDGNGSAHPPAEGDVDDDNNNFPPPDDDDEDMPMPPMDDEEDAAPPPMDDSGFANDMDLLDHGAANQSHNESSLDLGLVNDFGEDFDEEEEDRQAPGEDLVSSTSKWHKHTVKIFNFLHRMMSSDLNDSSKAHQLSFNKISAGVSRRTAAGVFLELLQLKTWDYITLEQDDAFGDIVVAPGPKFDEGGPKS